ncbi:MULTISPECIES: TauD/TfdA dioxygenase family protein [Cyanophyceae]|uniref:TauD/TfdA family dioxygenase n=1 Tax=Leptolyngbya subtilissima DQ-A4 TaxID=2933933 RepID=A0ABV0KAP7_9CYAN|nr:TauD/TfdA family dioxygenase [Nodosilinea sp. FACHB-141]MBD2111810.1 TauD/TfdA family dioxygenase [Nodosilinea sp. FACHB-141]
MSFVSLNLRPVAGRIGAEIFGLDLSDALSDDTIQALRRALVEHKVIFFRDQQRLDSEGQIAFARRFGPLTAAHPTLPPLEQRPEVLDLHYGQNHLYANYWHTDVTFVDRPPLGSILRAVELPPVGGDTIWANTVTAYQDLPAPLRTLADQLWAIHSNAYDYSTGAVNLSDFFKHNRAVFESTVFETRHPVVRIHPESGERALVLGGFVRRFQGLSQTESEDLLRTLQSYVTRPENTVRWQWRLGDVAFWDNRATQHYAIADYGDYPRRVQRVTVVGDLPVSPSGAHSTALKGDSAAYNGLVAVAF